MSVDATTAGQAARAAAGRVARANGWWGMVVFVATEATLFGTIIGSYFYLRFQATQWPPPGIEQPKLTLPLVLAGVLVATSVPVQVAFSSALRARLAVARSALLLAVVVQAGYLAMQVHLFLHDFDKVRPHDGAYGSIYVTMLGAHHVHVLVGLLLELWLLARLLGGLTNYRLVGLQTTAFYWHFVNVLAVCVVLTQLSPSL